MLPGLRKSLEDTHAALTVAFCRQAFRIRLSDMERHEQKTTLKYFGVDESLLRNDIYCEELTNERLKKFCNDYEEFKTQCAKVAMDNGLIWS